VESLGSRSVVMLEKEMGSSGPARSHVLTGR
jgi:hypothetical protein